MVAYICNQKRECCNTCDCAKNGGDCIYTFDPESALNGETKFPQKEPDRFEAQTFEVDNGNKSVTYYWERKAESDA